MEYLVSEMRKDATAGLLMPETFPFICTDTLFLMTGTISHQKKTEVWCLEVKRECMFCRGVGAMEIVAMDMKLRGMYIARQLSFHGVAFKIEEVGLSKEFVKVYDESVKLVSQFLKPCM